MEALRDAAAEAGEGAFATYIDIDLRTLAAWRAMAEEDSEAALSLARSAVDLEATTQKHPVTPGSYLPPSEALGDLLLEIGDPAEALEAYEKSLAVWPGRFNSLLGAARAARASGDRTSPGYAYANSITSRLQRIVDAASTTRPTGRRNGQTLYPARSNATVSNGM